MAATSPSAALSQRVGVLVVEDNPDLREMVAELLMNEGYHSIMAANGAEALQRMEGIVPDVLVTDLAMPDVDGVELLTTMRDDPRLREVPTVVITASGRARAEALLREVRLDCPILEKPFKIGALLEAVHRCAQRNRL
jgi:CheY-like chemotaxis protein